MSAVPTKVNSGYKCRVILHQCLAIVIRKEGCRNDPGDFWMYENGYLLFQGLLSSNSVCWWNTALNGAAKSLIYYGYISPGALLVASEPCAIDILKNAWARRVLQPPPGYQIVALEDIENCFGTPVCQTQWTPLPEAVCAVVLRLSRQGRPAGLETIREALMLMFPHVSPPSEQTLYDTLAQLTTERKLYHTSSGYFIVTPERRRSRSHSRGRRKNDENDMDSVAVAKTMLMSTEEALVMVHGDMASIRDGDVTHQLIQTNLADVICGGNSSDKIMYARSNKHRSSSFSVPRSPDRKGSFRLWRSNRRLRRSASTRTIAKNYAESTSTTESSDNNQIPSSNPNKKESLLSRLFRKSKRSQCQISTFSAQFPPTEWFNSKAVHLHSIGTQTSVSDKEVMSSLSSCLENCEIRPSRPATLPRRHYRQLSTDLTYSISRENSPVSKKMNHTYVPCTLPRNSLANKKLSKSRDSSRKTSRSSLSKQYNEPQTIENPPSIVNNSNRNCDNNSSSSTSKTSQKANKTDGGMDSSPDPNHMKSLDNSGPSSIESHKSSKTESSFTSGPSSLESHKTVINRSDTTSVLPSSSSTTTESTPILETKSLRRIPYNKSSSSMKTKTKSRPTMTNQASTTTTSSPLSHSNSFTLQVTTNQGVSKLNNNHPNATTTTTINGETGSSTKIYVQNSPIRSVITFENNTQSEDRNPNLVIINDTERAAKENHNDNNHNKYPMKNTNQCKEANQNLNNSRDILTSNNNGEIIEQKNTTMNNSRKLSLQLPSRDGLNFKNLIKNVSSTNSHHHNQFASISNPDSPNTVHANSFHELSTKTPTSVYNSTPPSPTISLASVGNIYIKNEVGSKSSLMGFESLDKLEKNNILGSEPNISYKEDYNSGFANTKDNRDQQFPSLNSLNDLTFNFTSLAAQKILKGVGLNSVDTLVELNMTANLDKQNNCDVVHTDFGLF